jgi:ornithine cyclodeaminase/alanine dehydrogenase-like protein (mu-crystallin family)
MLQLTEDDVRALDPARVLTAIEIAFRDRYDSVTIAPRIQIPVAGGIFLIMTCYSRTGNTLGTKLVVVRDNPVGSLERIEATYLLWNAGSSEPRLMIPANYLTDLRTAATSAVATRFLARKDAEVLGIFGTGRQARAHIKIMPLVRSFKRVLVCGTDAERTRRFAREMSSENLPVEASDAASCASEADVICTCTSSQTPVFDGRVFRPGTHLNLVGTFQPHAREVDSATMKRARIAVETYDGVLAEAGDLLIPLGERVISREQIVADLHELVSSKKSVRRSAEEVTVFKSVGCALEDLATAELLGG